VTFIVGVDPGKTGAIALLDMHNGELVAVEDMPAIGKHVNAAVVGDMLNDWQRLGKIVAIVEDVTSSPQMGVVSAFSFGRSKGIIEGCLGTLSVPVTLVTPAKWKRDIGLRADKDAARQLATNTWPTWADTFRRKKDDGRAEAALIALWGRSNRAALEVFGDAA